MKTIDLTIHFNCLNNEEDTYSYSFSDGDTLETIKDEIAQAEQDKAETERAEDEEEEQEITADDIKINQIECDDFTIPSDYNGTIEKQIEFLQAYSECDQGPEVVEAALYLSIEPHNIDEAYQGEYKDDEDFAQEIAEGIGAIDKNAAWPYTCIDWEQAARELMYDCSEHNGHYFRDL